MCEDADHWQHLIEGLRAGLSQLGYGNGPSPAEAAAFVDQFQKLTDGWI